MDYSTCGLVKFDLLLLNQAFNLSPKGLSCLDPGIF